MVTRSVETAAVVRKALEGKRTRLRGVVFEWSMLALLLASLLVLVVLLTDIVVASIPTFRARGIDFVTSSLSLNPETAGVASAIIGSFSISAIVALVAFPVGIGAAIYLEEYAGDTRLNRFINTNVRNLAGVPSIVYGLLGLALFVRLVDLVGLGGQTAGKNVVAAGLTLAILVLPIVIITASEALRAVPDSIREAGYGVGATQWEVIKHHVLPAAGPGILTGTVLTLARAFGETAPLIVIGVATGFFGLAADAGFYDRVTGPYTALPVVVFSWSRQSVGEFGETLAPAAIVVLLVVLFIANAAAIILRNRYDKRW